MIRLSAVTYYLEGVSEDFFWKELDRITTGQSMNPEFGYNKPYSGKSENIFAGRKVGNQFSIFLLRSPWNQFFRSAILCKGIVAARGRGIMVKCSFEYSFRNLVMFALLALNVLIFIKLDPIPFADELFFGAIGIAIYGLVVIRNYSKIKYEMGKQLELIEEKANIALLNSLSTYVHSPEIPRSR